MNDDVQTSRNGILLRVLAVPVIAVALVALAAACTNSLRRTCFLTGWLLIAVLATAFLRRFLKLRAGAPPEQWVGPQTLLAATIVSLFLMHIEFSRPNGWLDSLLTALFITIIFTSIVGTILWAKLRAGSLTGSSPAVKRWLCIHTPCVACLLALGSMHGVIAHAHGLLAHVMLGK